MGQYQKIIQIVGYQNSGKTTLMELLIRQATSEGLYVGAIKHHGHGGPPAVDDSKDSFRHEQAGASVTAVEGDGTLRMSITQSSWRLHDILEIYASFGIDMVFVEGYKNEHYPKVVLLRTGKDRELLEKVSNILCVIYWPTYPLEGTLEYPTFSIHEETQYLDFLMTKMRGNS